MTDQIKVLILNPTGTWEQTKGVLVDKYVRTREHPPTVINVSRDTVFPDEKPDVVETLSEIGAVIRRTKPVFSMRTGCIVVGQNDFSPLQYNPDQDNQAVRREASAFNQVTGNIASHEEAARALREEFWTKIGLVVAAVGAVAAFLIFLLVLLTGKVPFFGGQG